ncbi:murein biosynthesis integral membrane protein MurJ [SAR86 cluster bacterium]|nr:murein biosynthesis integral membrane protein MurJ [SAR86 cluster bacterium]
MDLAKNSFINSLFIFFSQISGFIRDIFIAAFLGSGLLSNIFIVALRLPFSFQQSLSGETFHSAFIPTLSSIDGENSIRKRHEFAKKILWISFLLLIPLILLTEIYMSYILRLVAPGFVDHPKFSLMVLCSRIAFPYLTFIVMSSVFSGLLNYRNKFSLTASLPIILNLTVISYITFSANFGESKVIYLCWTLLIGGVLQILFLLFSTDKDFWLSSINLKDGFLDVKKFFRLIAPTFFSQTFIQINVLVGIIFASFYEGAISYIYFADRVYMLPLTLTGISIATVLIPVLSRSIFLNDISSALNIQNKAYKLAIATIFPSSIILFMMSHEIIQFIYERGEFNSESTRSTASVLQLFSLGLPALCITKILSPYYFAKNDPQTPFKITTFSVIINIILTLILFQFIGYLSIPLSISLTAYITLAMYIYSHKKEDFFLFSNEIINYTIKFSFLCIGLSIQIWIIKELIQLLHFNNSIHLFISLISCLASTIIFMRLFDNELIKDMKSFMTKTVD